MSNEIFGIILHVALQGLIYSFVVMGVYFSSRVLKFDDLTTEGSFGVGGALTACLIVLGISPWAAWSSTPSKPVSLGEDHRTSRFRSTRPRSEDSHSSPVPDRSRSRLLRSASGARPIPNPWRCDYPGALRRWSTHPSVSRSFRLRR